MCRMCMQCTHTIFSTSFIKSPSPPPTGRIRQERYPKNGAPKPRLVRSLYMPALYFYAPEHNIRAAFSVHSQHHKYGVHCECTARCTRWMACALLGVAQFLRRFSRRPTTRERALITHSCAPTTITKSRWCYSFVRARVICTFLAMRLNITALHCIALHNRVDNRRARWASSPLISIHLVCDDDCMYGWEFCGICMRMFTWHIRNGWFVHFNQYTPATPTPTPTIYCGRI